MITHDLATHTASVAGAATRRYERVALRISELIEHGTLRPGERVPSVRRYSEQADVSVATVMQAYRLLENRGLIEARPQSGYYVRAKRWSATPELEIYMPKPATTPVKVADLIMQVVKAGRNPNMVRLGATLPHPALLPTVELNRTTAAVARRHPDAANAYSPPPGDAGLRREVARRALEAGCTLSPDDIVVTCGATEAINLCLRAVARPGDVIAIESPTFFGMLQTIESLGMKVCEIPTYPRDGICLDELESRLKRYPIKACLFTLNFSNPLGSCMPDEKKQALVKLLARRGIPLIEDDLYGNLAFGATRPKAAKAFDEEGLVMLCDSFTKTLAPGSRVGWVAPGRFKERIEFLKYVNTATTASLPQMGIAEFLRNGSFDHHLRKLRRCYSEQLHLMTGAVARHFPTGTKISRPTGGMALWVEMPGQVNTLRVYEQALEQGISVAPGPIFSAKQGFQNFLRLNFGNPWTDAIEQAVAKLGRIIRTLAGQNGDGSKKGS